MCSVCFETSPSLTLLLGAGNIGTDAAMDQRLSLRLDLDTCRQRQVAKSSRAAALDRKSVQYCSGESDATVYNRVIYSVIFLDNVLYRESCGLSPCRRF